MQLLHHPLIKLHSIFFLLVLILSSTTFGGVDPEALADPNGINPAKILQAYHDAMCIPKPLVVREGREFQEHQCHLKEKVRRIMGLSPLPERVDLDIHLSEPLDHPWCAVRRISYQTWPGVYSDGLLYMPKDFIEEPAPAMLCPHGHWENGSAHPEVQKRCLTFAKMGYVTFCPTQNHYEDLAIGISHQTVNVWNNMRALDYLETLPQVDRDRIGSCGCSGGGMQTQMLAALDGRVKAATIAGMTCDFKDIMWTAGAHCPCNHFPNVMRFTGHPEISALAFPTPIQYLTMNDWTREFAARYIPTIRELYTANGYPDRVDCKYWSTPHNYDRPKRERTYWWMEWWLRGRNPAEWPSEPDNIETFEVQTLQELQAPVAGNKGFGGVTAYYEKTRVYRTPVIENEKEWRTWRENMIAELQELMGLDAILPRQTETPQTVSRETTGGLIVERINFPSEGGILVPAIVLRSNDSGGKRPVVIICNKDGKEKLLKKNGAGSSAELARQGALVVLPDLRFVGALDLLKISFKGQKPVLNAHGWNRNAIVWGRPIPAMACTDIQGILDGLESRPDADMTNLKIVSTYSRTSIAVLLAMALDSRIRAAQLDFQQACYRKRALPMVPFVLQHGDVLQWSALLADRQLTLYNIPKEAGDPDWLRAIFAVLGNRKDLHIATR